MPRSVAHDAPQWQDPCRQPHYSPIHPLRDVAAPDCTASIGASAEVKREPLESEDWLAERCDIEVNCPFAKRSHIDRCDTSPVGITRDAEVATVTVARQTAGWFARDRRFDGKHLRREARAPATGTTSPNHQRVVDKHAVAPSRVPVTHPTLDQGSLARQWRTPSVLDHSPRVASDLLPTSGATSPGKVT